jgi:riboflavin synthase
MFTGIIQTVGEIKTKDESEQGTVFSFSSTDLDFSDSNVGDSIAVNGVCLTAIEIGNDYFKADISKETIDCSTFSTLILGDKVNLEKSLKLNQGIDGHIVSGHVDGIAEIIDKFTEAGSTRFKIKAPKNLVQYIARKGSICVNGVSLTVNSIDGGVFDINIVPHTINATNLGLLKLNDSVNIEVDIIARHLEQLLSARG